MEHAETAATFIGGGVEAVPFGGLQCDRILIAVPDSAIVDVALQLPPSAKTLLHTCGAHGAELLNPLRELGAHCGAIHPLQTFATPDAGYHALAGISFAIDGDGDALVWAEEIANLLDGSILRIPGASRALYHAATAIASNHLIAVMDAAIQTMQRAGLSETTAIVALSPMMRTSLQNAIERGPTQALTGPVERGDLHTVELHLGAMAQMTPSIQNLYRAGSLQALTIARQRGMEPGIAARFEELLA